MRYVSTLNPKTELDIDVVMRLAFAPDSGCIMPQSIPILLKYQLRELADLPFWACFHQVLGRFLPTGELDRSMKLPQPTLLDTRDHVTLIELWDPRTGKLEATVSRILEKLGCRQVSPGTWPYTAAHIAMLFSLYGEAVRQGTLSFGDDMVLALEDDSFDFSAAARYAKRMGLPVETVILSCQDDLYGNGSSWELLYRGQLLKRMPQPMLLTLCDVLGEEHTNQLYSSIGGDSKWILPEEYRKELRKVYFPEVISNDARCNMLRQLYRTEHILVSPPTAAAFVAAGQYRARFALRCPIFVLGLESPLLWGETVLNAMRIKRQNVLIQIETLEQAAKAAREGI